MLTDTISYKVAKELARHNLYYYEPISNYYATSKGRISYNDGSEDVEVCKGDLIHYTEFPYFDKKDSGIPAPTYANVLDALSIAGMNINLYYKNGFIGFNVNKQNTAASDTQIVPEHWEDESLERGIINACELLDLYPDEYKNPIDE